MTVKRRWAPKVESDPSRPLPCEEYERLGVEPFQNLPDRMRAEINEECIGDAPPDKVKRFLFCQMTSRSWFEWFVRRGIDPRLLREKISPELRTSIAKRDGMICGICGDDIESLSDLHIDHVRPVSLGGGNNPSNLRAAHASCNVRRGNRVDGSSQDRQAQ